MPTPASHGHSGLGARAERCRTTASLAIRHRAALRRAIRLSHKLGLGPLVTPQTTESSRSLNGSHQAAAAEFADGEGFFRQFEGALVPEALSGLRLLDLGSGYGGRTVFYATQCGADHVHGIEITEAVVERSRAFAREHRAENVSFEVGFAERLPCASESFDAVVSFDVLEHVQDPRAAVREIARVLRPGGRAWLAFPSYLGVRASHLDYLTMLPGLHRVFDPTTVVSVVNEFLTAEPDRFRTRPQPEPQISSLGRLTLPGLNGLTIKSARDAIDRSGLRVDREGRTPFITETVPVPGAAIACAVLTRVRDTVGLPEALVGNVALSLSKPFR